MGGVAVGQSGEVYVTTATGGAGFGGVYELLPPTTPGAAWTKVPLHTFNTTGPNGPPAAGVLLTPSGALYGVTPNNANGTVLGTIFQLEPPADPDAKWRLTVLHEFTGSNGDGGTTRTTPVLGPRGKLYGTAAMGGSGSQPDGAVYSMTPPGLKGGTWKEQVIASFSDS